MSDQADSLRRINKSPLVLLAPARRRVVAVTGGKGGVGKSTVAVNLAVTWAKRGARCLALDGDLGMADLNLLMGLAPHRSILDLVQGAPIEDVLVEAHGIHLLPALNGSFQAANLGVRARQTLVECIGEVASRFDTLVVDTAAGIGDNAISLAAMASDVVVVATSDPLSLADAYACLKVLSTRMGLTRAFLLPNSVRTPSEGDDITDRLQSLVDRFLGIEVVPLPPVPYDPAIRASAAAGIPFVIHNPETPAARAIRKVARRIDDLAQEADGPSVLRSWLTESMSAAEGGK